MARRRWIADRSHADRAWITGDNAAHLARVLRASPGQQFEIAADGVVRLGTITNITDDEVEFQLAEALAQSAIAPTILALAVFKFDRFEWAIEKAAEFGVFEIIPLIARRTDPHLASAATKRVERWRRIAREAAQQSRQAEIAAVRDPLPLARWIQQPVIQQNDAARILLSEEEHDLRLMDLARDLADTPATLAIGPEGGWAPDEFDLFRRSRWRAATLGPSILRAETATIAALAVIAQARLPVAK